MITLLRSGFVVVVVASVVTGCASNDVRNASCAHDDDCAADPGCIGGACVGDDEVGIADEVGVDAPADVSPDADVDAEADAADVGAPDSDVEEGLACGIAADCDDDNPCTDDACVAGICRWTALSDDLGADDVAGNCLRLACVDGAIEQVLDEDDVPADDGIACTFETCALGFPLHYADHDVCDDGDDRNGYELCSPADGGCIPGEPPDWYCETPEPSWTSSEICGDGQDNDANGLADEGCPCELGSVQRCFVGSPEARGVGACVDGFQYCAGVDSPSWSECTGGVVPGPERCDSRDNDCNGCADDMWDCYPMLLCPDEDVARPLTWYELDGEALWIGRRVVWDWSVQAPPNSATIEVEDRTAERTRVYLDVHGDYVISATATNDVGIRYACSWIVSARGDGLSVEMRWDTQGDVDMDLHLHQPGNTQDWCSPADCYFVTCRGAGSGGWGYPESPDDMCPTPPCGNPRLDVDNVRGLDPEIINLDNPRDGDTFRIMAHMYSGSQRTNPVVSIYCGGLLRAVFGEAPDELGLNQSGGGCGGQTWRVADVTMTVDPGTGATDCTVDVLTTSSGDWDVRVNDQSY